MKANPKKILFISHDASRTGAPLILLNLLKWIKKNTSIQFIILIKKDGDLRQEFEKLAPVLIFYKNLIWIKEKLFSRLYLYNNKIRKRLLAENIGLIYSNTVTNGKLLDSLSFLKCPVISHAHELEGEIKNNGKKNFELIKKFTDHYIAVSEEVKTNLIKNHSISENKISKIYGFVPLSEIKTYVERKEILQQIGIKQKSFIVCACGSIGTRKGADLFIKIADVVVNKKKNNIYFLWIGKENGGNLTISQMQKAINKLGLNEKVKFIGEKFPAYNFINACDLFTLTSREDPFPLVMLEAGFLSKPILCFSGTGGAEEFIKNDAGFVVPYLDIEVMAEKIIKLSNNPDLRRKMGQAANEKAKKYDIEIHAQKILKILRIFIRKIGF